MSQSPTVKLVADIELERILRENRENRERVLKNLEDKAQALYDFVRATKRARL